MRLWLPTLLFLVAALPARAETYKWVDEKGVTNYSSAPPASAAKKSTVVEDRVSVVPTDPSWKEAAAASAARPDYATEEWLQRQRLMALKDSYTATNVYADDYYPSYGYGYGYPGYAYPARPGHPAARARAIHATFAPVVTPFRPAATPARASGSRGALSR